MKKRVLAIFIVAFAILMTGCNAITRYYGGTTTINLEPNSKFVDITWKDNSLWILTKSMQENDIAETYFFEEDSNFGILEGKVIIVEQKGE